MMGHNRMPYSATHDQFEYDEALIAPAALDCRVHLKKNDLSEHTEQSAGIMKALMTNK